MSLYKSGLPPVQIAETLNCCTVNIINRLRKLGINYKRDYSTTRRKRLNRYLVDEEYFDKINTEDKAYFFRINVFRW